MAKVVLILEDEIENGKPMLHITLESDPPFANENATAAQFAGVRALKAASSYAKRNARRAFEEEDEEDDE